jgi:exocyst complex component 5
MCAICDVNEYRKCVKAYKQPLVDTLFDSLHALCNLLLVKPENLQQVCNGEQLVIYLKNLNSISDAGFLFQAGLDRSILLNFIQLRSDYKTQKLANSLKGLAS